MAEFPIDLPSVERQLAQAWYDEVLRLQAEINELKEKYTMLRNALITAQSWMPRAKDIIMESTLNDVKQVHEALGWELKL